LLSRVHLCKGGTGRHPCALAQADAPTDVAAAVVAVDPAAVHAVDNLLSGVHLCKGGTGRHPCALAQADTPADVAAAVVAVVPAAVHAVVNCSAACTYARVAQAATHAQLPRLILL